MVELLLRLDLRIYGWENNLEENMARVFVTKITITVTCPACLEVRTIDVSSPDILGGVNEWNELFVNIEDTCPCGEVCTVRLK